MSGEWQPLASATLIGSMPHRDRDQVVGLILDAMTEIPVWPQLPVYVPEQMMTQYLEGLPGLRHGESQLFVDLDGADFDAELLAFYEETLEIEAGSRDLAESRFALGTETGATFFRFLESVAGRASGLRAVKGQVVGPFTLLSGLNDRTGRAVLYDERMAEVVPRHLAMKAAWQIRRLKAIGVPVICFLDEPALAGFGSSAYISITREFVLQLLREVSDAVHAEGALSGIHICANTDWSLAFDSGVDIINLDAYHYADKLALYGDAFKAFLERGGCVAWGLVPTSDPALVEKETAQSLADRWFETLRAFEATGLSTRTILERSLFTPSCGCGSLSVATSERVVRLTAELSGIMRAALHKMGL